MTDILGGRAFVAIVVMGVSASGKSIIGEHLARRLGWMFEDGDDFHSAHNIEKMRAGHPLTDDDRWPWLKAIAAEIDRCRLRRQSVIVACSALRRAYRGVLVAGHTDVRIVYMRGDRALIEGRLREREGHFMPPGLLASQFATLEEPDCDEHVIVVDDRLSVDDAVDQIVSALGRS